MAEEAAKSTAVEGLSAADLYRLRWAGDARISPAGDELIFVVTSIDKDSNGYTSQLWLAPFEGGEPTQFTSGTKQDKSPRWSPDGTRIAFLSNRDGKNQLYLIDRQGGEARKLTDLEGGVSSPAWSPDGTRIAFVSRKKSGESGDDADDEAGKSDVRVINRLRYKTDGVGWWDGKRAQVFVLQLDTGNVQQVTEGPYDHGSPAWSPDGKRLIVVADRAEDADYVNRSDLWMYDLETDLDTPGEPVKLTAGKGPAGSPAWSPDGKLVAYTGHENEFSGASLTRLYLVNPDDPGSPWCVTRDFDRSILSGVTSDMAGFSPGSALEWSSDAKRIFFTAADGGTVCLYSAEVETGDVATELAGERVLSSVHLGPDGKTYAAVVTAPAVPADVFVGTLGAEERRVTDLSGELLADRVLSEPQRVVFEGSLGRTIEAWLMYPVGYRPGSGKKVPLVLEIHGGPHANYGWSFFHEFQVLASRGYAVLAPNPHGSQGYGQEFVAATHHDWGGKDYQDLMRGVDYVLTHGTIDEARLGVTGGSFGGFMTNWIISHTNRFAAAVTQRSTSNRYSMFGTKDFGYMDGNFEYDGNPWDNPDHYLEHSPITYVNNVATPLLMIHSENDMRCPLEQSEQFFTALKWLRKEVELVIFPKESHGLSRGGQPKHRIERLERIAGWFDKHL